MVAPPYKQQWTVQRVVCFLTYALLAKHLPSSGDLGFFGAMSNWFRRIVCRPLFKESAAVITVGKGVDFDNGCFVVMKHCANLGDYALLGGNFATITIGQHVMMGKYCVIINQNHRYLDEGYAGFEGKDVVIDDYAWIGHRVTILPGVRIGRHAIVGAGAVVTKSIPDYAIAVGNPAVVKKYRKGDVIKTVSG